MAEVNLFQGQIQWLHIQHSMKVIKDTYIHINIGTKDRIDWSALFHCKVVKEDSENNSGFKVLQKREILASN